MSKDVFRREYKPLTDEQQHRIETIKIRASTLYSMLDELPACRETSLAKTRLEEAVMWAVKSETGRSG